MNAAEALRAERDGPILAVTLDPDMGVGELGWVRRGPGFVGRAVHAAGSVRVA